MDRKKVSPDSSGGCVGTETWKEEVGEEIITEDGVNADGELSPQDQNRLFPFPVENQRQRQSLVFER